MIPESRQRHPGEKRLSIFPDSSFGTAQTPPASRRKPVSPKHCWPSTRDPSFRVCRFTRKPYLKPSRPFRHTGESRYLSRSRRFKHWEIPVFTGMTLLHLGFTTVSFPMRHVFGTARIWKASATDVWGRPSAVASITACPQGAHGRGWLSEERRERIEGGDSALAAFQRRSSRSRASVHSPRPPPPRR